MQHMVYKDTYVAMMNDKVEACVEYEVVWKMYVYKCIVCVISFRYRIIFSKVFVNVSVKELCLKHVVKKIYV